MPADQTNPAQYRFARICLAASLAGMAMASGSAVHASSDEVRRDDAGYKAVRVAFHTLDLTQRSQRGMLDRRLYGAVREVCGGRPLVRFGQGHRQYRTCKQRARASYKLQLKVALNNANARRVAALSDRLSVVGMRF